MEFGTREILIILGILVLLAILLDGVRRVGKSRRGKLKVATRRSREAIFNDEQDLYGSELPNGPSRVVGVRDPEAVELVSEKIKRNCDYTRNKFTSAFSAIRDQQNNRVVDHDPDIFDDHGPLTSEEPDEPLYADDDFIDQDHGITEPERPQPAEEPVAPLRSEDVSPTPGRASEPAGPDPDTEIRAAATSPSENLQATPASPHQVSDAERSAMTDRGARGRGAPEDILVLHLMARKGEQFDGEALLEQLLDQGCRYGSMKIFHHHANKDGSGPVHFSVANSVKPGTFDLNSMEEFSTPGITFIMPLEDLDKPLDSFEKMITVAVGMAKKLNGDLKDETRSAMTKQTIEHYRQRIIDYTRRSFTLTN
ncbi:MAG: cell division protein ZipA [Porticoccaceae bacterium]|nr:cell division protein ZipA [Porticoccaceae bacterium]